MRARQAFCADIFEYGLDQPAHRAVHQVTVVNRFGHETPFRIVASIGDSTLKGRGGGQNAASAAVTAAEIAST
ncbi:MAG: hypothetical protein ACD_54C01160G0001 [uncultured bacterium]|nr:MAG: hypothetical protein ACD_54C01160G0001 [uncultured bacterium]